MKLSEYAKQRGISYRTAWNWYRAGKLSGEQIGRTILVNIGGPDSETNRPDKRVAIYARVSFSENRSNLDSQAERVANWCTQRGSQIVKTVREVGSGVNDERPKLMALLRDIQADTIVVEHRDRLTRFGFNYIAVLLEQQGRHIEVVNVSENPTQRLIDDLVAIVYSFSARLYGTRRAKHHAARLKADLEQRDDR